MNFNPHSKLLKIIINNNLILFSYIKNDNEGGHGSHEQAMRFVNTAMITRKIK